MAWRTTSEGVSGAPGTAPAAHMCMFCGSKVDNQGEAYYDHLRASKQCEHAWRQWRENLYADHPGGD